jgi:hypothetical protein
LLRRAVIPGLMNNSLAHILKKSIRLLIFFIQPVERD